MRDVMERFVVLPFSMGCASQSSIAVGSNPSKKSKFESKTAITGTQEGESSSRMKMKNPWGSNISRKIHKFIASLKSFSQLFDYNEDEAVEELEIEIGFPTDVKHVTHIGWDGSMSRNAEKNWPENLQTPELLSFPSLTLKQFELAMAAQADAPTGLNPPSEPTQLDFKQIG